MGFRVYTAGMRSLLGAALAALLLAAFPIAARADLWIYGIHLYPVLIRNNFSGCQMLDTHVQPIGRVRCNLAYGKDMGIGWKRVGEYESRHAICAITAWNVGSTFKGDIWHVNIQPNTSMKCGFRWKGPNTVEIFEVK